MTAFLLFVALVAGVAAYISLAAYWIAHGAAVWWFIVGAPIAQAHGYSAFAGSIYKAFSHVCHQIPERSFHLAGHQFAVCSRCMGLYAGFALVALAYPFARSLKRTDAPGRIWLILAAVPLAVDFALGYFAIWENTHLSRFVTGALLSSVAVFYVMPGLIDLIQIIGRRPHRKTTGERPQMITGK